MAKITKATFKSFLKKNEGKLLIKTGSRFDGMVDCVMPTGETSFSPLRRTDNVHENNLGYNGIWLVPGSGRHGNSFDYFENNGLKGYRVYNCCGSFTVAVVA